MIKKLLMIAVIGAIALNVHGALAETESSGDTTTSTGSTSAEATSAEELRQEIIKLMLVNPKTKINSNEKKFEDNINSVRENQNKIKLNAVTRSIAVGRRAVALGIKSGEDVDERRKAIESKDDVLSMLKDIAKLQAQHLQKINEITSLRAKIVELNSIESILSGGVATTDKAALGKSGSSDGSSSGDDAESDSDSSI